MSKIILTTIIDRPIGDVFDYTTEPDNWPKWHPASRSVSGAVDHPLTLGEEVREEFNVAGRTGELHMDRHWPRISSPMVDCHANAVGARRNHISLEGKGREHRV